MRIQTTDASIRAIPLNPPAQHLTRPKDIQPPCKSQHLQAERFHAHAASGNTRTNREKDGRHSNTTRGATTTLSNEKPRLFVASGILRCPWMDECCERRMLWSGPLAALAEPFTTVASGILPLATLVHPCTARLPTLTGGVYLICSKMPSSSSRLL